MSVFQDLTITEKDFQRLVQFLQKNYGIDLTKKKSLIESRLSHSIKSMGYPSMESFLEHLFKTRDSADIELIINKLTTNYTYFMREKEHFLYLQNKILPELVARHQRDHSLSIWSAGCSSGEEPYTLSIYLKEFFGNQASMWDTRVLATDISQQAMKKARAGLYKKPDDMPAPWLKKYFTLDKESGMYAVSPVLKNNVIFRPFNLMEPIQFKTKFDVIFCRNVMIYFDQPTRDALVARFHGALNPGGHLIISLSESLGQNPLYRLVSPSIYQKK